MIIKTVLKIRTAVCQVTFKRAGKTLTEDSHNTYIKKKKDFYPEYLLDNDNEFL